MENRISGRTQLYCLIGTPVGHSKSPAMYNYSFARTGVDAVYLAFDVPQENLKAAIEAIKTLNVKGFNVTMPDKTDVIKYLDEVTPTAGLIGACNTVTVSEDGKLTGHNTDCTGFADNLRSHGVELCGKRVVLLGAGGAATAICVQAALDGAEEISVFNRRGASYDAHLKSINKIADAFSACRISMNDINDRNILPDAVGSCDILVNATKVGMKPMDDISLVDPGLLRAEMAVVDTVYNPLETRLIKDAKAAGCKAAIGGIGMLLWQGAAAFRLFTGKEMPFGEVKEKFFYGE